MVHKNKWYLNAVYGLENFKVLRTQEISVALHINPCLICTVNPRVCLAENAPTVLTWNTSVYLQPSHWWHAEHAAKML